MRTTALEIRGGQREALLYSVPVINSNCVVEPIAEQAEFSRQRASGYIDDILDFANSVFFGVEVEVGIDDFRRALSALACLGPDCANPRQGQLCQEMLANAWSMIEDVEDFLMGLRDWLVDFSLCLTGSQRRRALGLATVRRALMPVVSAR